MIEAVVVDASFAVKWGIPESSSDEALTLAESWGEEGVRVLAPCLILAEVTNAVYKRVVRGEVELETALSALDVILGFGIELEERAGFPARAVELACEFGLKTTYDCHYLAVAEYHDCELWTADRRFYNSVKAGTSRVRCVSEA